MSETNQTPAYPGAERWTTVDRGFETNVLDIVVIDGRRVITTNMPTKLAKVLVLAHNAAIDKLEQRAKTILLAGADYAKAYKSEIAVLSQRLQAVERERDACRTAIQRFFQWAAAVVLPDDWPRENDIPVLPAELLRRALSSLTPSSPESGDK